jgi:triosephosphate isomerase
MVTRFWSCWYCSCAYRRAQVLKDGMKAVLCIGETQAQYQAGLSQEVK